MKTGPLALTFLVAASVPAWTQTLNCENPTSQVEMTGCADRELTAADDALNRTYADAMRIARERDEDGHPGSAVPVVSLLRDAQRAWIPFRDRACDLEASAWAGGSGQSMAYLQCKTRLTRERSRDLCLFMDMTRSLEECS